MNLIVSGSSSQPSPGPATAAGTVADAGTTAGAAAHAENVFTCGGKAWSGSPFGTTSLSTKNVSSNSHEPPGGKIDRFLILAIRVAGEGAEDVVFERDDLNGDVGWVGHGEREGDVLALRRDEMVIGDLQDLDGEVVVRMTSM